MTKISEDRLRELCSGSVMAAATPGEEIAMARELLSLRTSPPPSGEAGEPKVRPLEWVDRIVDDEGGGSDVVGSAAQTAYPQQYWTSLHHEEDGKWRLYFGLSIIGRFETEDDAKNAAQSDYETRIRSALLPTIKEPTETPTHPPIGDGEMDLGATRGPATQENKYTPEEREALGLMAIFILSGDDFEPKHAKIVLNIMAGMEQELKRLKAEGSTREAAKPKEPQ
jgi:hypothetical protein